MDQHKLTATLYKVYMKSNPGDVNLCVHVPWGSAWGCCLVVFYPCYYHHAADIVDVFCKLWKFPLSGCFFPVRLSHHRWTDVNYEDVTFNFLIVHKGKTGFWGGEKNNIRFWKESKGTNVFFIRGNPQMRSGSKIPWLLVSMSWPESSQDPQWWWWQRGQGCVKVGSFPQPLGHRSPHSMISISDSVLAVC